MILFAIGCRDLGFPSATGNELYFSFQIHINLEIWLSASRSLGSGLVVGGLVVSSTYCWWSGAVGKHVWELFSLHEEAQGNCVANCFAV